MTEDERKIEVFANEVSPKLHKVNRAFYKLLQILEDNGLQSVHSCCENSQCMVKLIAAFTMADQLGLHEELFNHLQEFLVKHQDKLPPEAFGPDEWDDIIQTEEDGE